MNLFSETLSSRRPHWKNVGIAAFCGIAFGSGYSFAGHSMSMIAWMGFGLLLGLLKTLLEVGREPRQDKNPDEMSGLHHS